MTVLNMAIEPRSVVQARIIRVLGLVSLLEMPTQSAGFILLVYFGAHIHEGHKSCLGLITFTIVGFRWGLGSLLPISNCNNKKYGLSTIVNDCQRLSTIACAVKWRWW